MDILFFTEEILSSSSALWWSPDGTKLSFATFNDSNVDVLQYPYYGSYSKINNVYPELKNLRYPKVSFVYLVKDTKCNFFFFFNKLNLLFS